MYNLFKLLQLINKFNTIGLLPVRLNNLPAKLQLQ